LPPTEGRGQGPRKPRKRKSPSIRDAAATAAGSALPAPEPTTEGLPAFPDFETPSARWNPWDETIGTEADGQSPDFDSQRTLGEWLEAVIPPEAQGHFIRAGQEFAAGVQTTVDHHLGRGAGADGARPGPSRIEIE
jgi:hypothetical protein